MTCSRCGSSTPPRGGRCVVCGAALAAASTTGAAGDLGTHLGGGDDATRPGPPLPPSGDEPTHAGESSLLGPDAPTGSSLHRTISESPASALATGTGDEATGPGYGAAVSADPDAPTGAGIGGVKTAARQHGGGGTGPLNPGQDFGARYHIIRLLGIGGMGAVYQAWDKTLEVAVAIKVIRPPDGVSADEAQAAEKRFKRELLLARKVTHRNVVRIHDLGEIDGITYITMPYVQGSDLSSILKKEGRLDPARALAIGRQIASGLAAAHDAGIVHRDLKPANIMIDADGDAMIMDFGIARSTAAGLTMTAGGAVIGTIEYMAPEQARGVPVDQRADVYAFGLILNDMLLGRRQMGSTTAVAELMDRMQKAPAPLRSIDPTIPEMLEAVVTKCLQPDPAARFQKISELLALLDTAAAPAGFSGTDGATAVTARPGWTATTSGAATTAVPAPSRSRWLWPAIAAAVVVVGVAGWALRDQFFNSSPSSATSGPVISLAILPFRNDSGDVSLDSTGSGLSEVLRTQLGQSSRVRTVSADRLHQVLRDLQMTPSAKLAPADIGRVAEFTSARRVLWGSISTLGDSIRIDVTLQNLDADNRSTALSAMAANRTSPALLAAVGELADKVRNELASGSADVLAELKATSWKPSTSSFDALRLYNEGVLLTQQGNHQEALKRFEEATRLDGDFALAYSALARTHQSLRYDNEAAKFSQQAMSLSAALPPQEKYTIAANHYRITNKTAEAIDAYENLAKASPNNPMVLFDLGGLYEQRGELEKAEGYFANVVKLDPKFVEGLLALGRVQIRRNNFQGSLEHLNNALTLSIQFNHDEARGNILQAIGIAYKRLSKFDEALKHYQESLEIKTRRGNKGGMAGSLGEIAQVREAQGQPREAEESYNAALKLQREIGDKSGQSVTLINLATLVQDQGQPERALPLLREALQFRREAGNPVGISLVLNNIGSVYLARGEFSEALTYLEQALDLREKSKTPGPLADTVHNLAETLSKMGRYDESLKYYLRALDLRRSANDPRGAAIEQYSTGNIFDDQARYGAAVKAKADALQAFREQKRRDRFLGEAMSGHGASLSLAGRMDAAKPALDEALALARELNNPRLIAQALRYESHRLLLAGDGKAGAAIAAEAAATAAKASDRALTLHTQAAVATIAATLTPTKALASTFAQLAQEAETLGLKPLAVECSVHRAETLLALNDAAGARQEADRAIARAETAGFRLLAAKAHFVRGEALRRATDPAARRAYQSALRILDEIKAEEGSQDVLKRSDLGAVYTEAARWAK